MCLWGSWPAPLPSELTQLVTQSDAQDPTTEISSEGPYRGVLRKRPKTRRRRQAALEDRCRALQGEVEAAQAGAAYGPRNSDICVPYAPTFLHIGPSVSFHLDLGEGIWEFPNQGP